MSNDKLSKDEQLMYLYLYSLELEFEDGFRAYQITEIIDGIMSLCDVSFDDVIDTLNSLLRKDLILSKAINGKVYYIAKMPERAYHIKGGIEVLYADMIN